jgi:hypothetical protein
MNITEYNAVLESPSVEEFIALRHKVGEKKQTLKWPK